MTNPLASQQPAPIPDDLEQFYKGDQYAVAEWSESREMWVLYDVPITLDGLIDRIARLEAALTALRDFMWSEGYADQTAVMRQADAALGTPTTKEFMQKVCSDAYEGTPGKGEK
jgi:hypothetical protein